MASPEYIVKLLDKWAKTQRGKAVIKEKYGIDYEGDGDIIRKEYAEKMKSILYKHIHPIIKSIMFDDIIIGSTHKNPDGTSSIKISFRPGSLHRESLRPDLYPDGLDNIVLLLAHGYNAAHTVYGVWENSRSYPNIIESRQSREPNDFLHNAVAEFNSYAGDNATAYLEDSYI